MFHSSKNYLYHNETPAHPFVSDPYLRVIYPGSGYLYLSFVRPNLFLPASKLSRMGLKGSGRFWPWSEDFRMVANMYAKDPRVGWTARARPQVFIPATRIRGHRAYQTGGESIELVFSTSVVRLLFLNARQHSCAITGWLHGSHSVEFRATWHAIPVIDLKRQQVAY